MEWSAKNYAENARFVSDLGAPILDLLCSQTGERILDLGCGDGELTSKLLDQGCEVVGVDSSSSMVEAAMSRGLNAHVVDGQKLLFDDEFDAVFSNAALHWMTDPTSVVEGVYRALRRDGRFVGEFGGFGNVSKIISAIESRLSSRGLAVAKPWYFPRPREYQSLLESAGFEVTKIALIPRPTILPSSVRGWLMTFAHPYTSVVPETGRDDFISEVVEELRKGLVDSDGQWVADYVRLRFAATRS